MLGPRQRVKEPQLMALQSCALGKEQKESRTEAVGQEPSGHSQARLRRNWCPKGNLLPHLHPISSKASVRGVGLEPLP